MICWLKKREKKFPRLISAEFMSDWLEILIHIHRTRGFSHILNCSLMSEDVLSGQGTEEDA